LRVVSPVTFVIGFLIVALFTTTRAPRFPPALYTTLAEPVHTVPASAPLMNSSSPLVRFTTANRAGGYLVAAKSLSKTDEAIQRVDEAIKRVKESNKTEKLNIPGIATVYLAPQEKSLELPPDRRGQYRFTGPAARPLQDQITRKINEKSSQISVGGNS
jgi:hypothetical protein